MGNPLPEPETEGYRGGIASGKRRPSGRLVTRSPVRIPKGILRATLFLALLAGGLALLIAYDFDLQALLRTGQETPPWLFVAAMVILPVVGFPISIFYVFAGSAFSWPVGTLLCIISLAANTALSYWITRTLLHETVERFLSRRGFEIPRLQEVNAFRLTFLLRTVPGPPFPVQNYLLALASVPFAIYWPISVLCQGLFATGTCFLVSHTLSRDQITAIAIIGTVALTFVGIQGARLLRKHSRINRLPADTAPQHNFEKSSGS